MHHRSRILSVALVVFVASCDSAVDLPTSTPAEEAQLACTPGEAARTGCVPANYFSTKFGPDGDVLYQAPNDPTPGANGLWLGTAVTDSNCMATTALVVDSDRDNLSDHCELELAKAFAPSLRFGNDPCEAAQPHWAAKVFASKKVRIAYLMAYHDDCGVPEGQFPPSGWTRHRGDAEMIVVEVWYVASTQRWYFQRMFLTAHLWADLLGGAIQIDRSKWVNEYQAQFKHRTWGNPTVWVAVGKHSNYYSMADCDASDECEDVVRDIRFPVYPERNIGSPAVPFRDCYISPGHNSSTGRTECFWQVKAFNGWYGPDTLYLGDLVSPGITGVGDSIFIDGVTPYGAQLRGGFFAKRGCHSYETQGDCSDGVESGYVMPPPTLSLSGPTYGREELVTVNAAITSGFPTSGIHYTWTYRICAYQPSGQPCTMGFSPYQSGVDVTQANIWMLATDQWAEFQVQARMSSSQPPFATVTHSIMGANEGANPCYPDWCESR